MSENVSPTAVDDWREVTSSTNARDGTLSIHYLKSPKSYKVTYVEKGFDASEILNEISELVDGAEPCADDVKKILGACNRVMYSVGYQIDVRNFG